jgi:hypothetical protein
VNEAVKVVELKTRSMAHVVLRDVAGHKLFDVDIHGVCITVTTSLDAEIRVDPDSEPKDGRCV